MRSTRLLPFLATAALLSCDPPPAVAPTTTLVIPAETTAAPIAAPPPPEVPCPGAGARTVCGVVLFTGTPPVPVVPRARAESTFFCGVNPAPHDAVMVRDGRLADVLVRIVLPSPPSALAKPSAPVTVRESGCQLKPRVTGALVGSTLEIVNEDSILNNVHALYADGQTWFNQAHVMGGRALEKVLEAPGFVRLIDDVHPWKNGFVFVSTDSFFAVTGAEGTFAIPNLPPGEYDVEAWHSIFGRKRARVSVRDDGPTKLLLTYQGDEPPPAENPVAARDRAGFQ